MGDFLERKISHSGRNLCESNFLSSVNAESWRERERERLEQKYEKDFQGNARHIRRYGILDSSLVKPSIFRAYATRY